MFQGFPAKISDRKYKQRCIMQSFVSQNDTAMNYIRHKGLGVVGWCEGVG